MPEGCVSSWICPSWQHLNNAWIGNILLFQSCYHHQCSLVRQTNKYKPLHQTKYRQNIDLSTLTEYLYFITVCLVPPPAVASAWLSVSVSSVPRMPRGSTCVWPVGTCDGLAPLVQPWSAPIPRPKWRCCWWTPAASARCSVLHGSSNSGGRIHSRFSLHLSCIFGILLHGCVDTHQIVK